MPRLIAFCSLYALIRCKCRDSMQVRQVANPQIGEFALWPNGHGLMIMRERAEAVGGTLRISSPSGKGTQIEAVLPFYSGDKTNAGNEERV